MIGTFARLIEIVQTQPTEPTYCLYFKQAWLTVVSCKHVVQVQAVQQHQVEGIECRTALLGGHSALGVDGPVAFQCQTVNGA